MDSEKDLAAWAYSKIREGAQRRVTGAPNRYAGNTLAHLLSAQGWLTEDLRQALMKANPVYAVSQAAFERTV